VRATTLLRRLLCTPQLRVLGCHVDEGALVVRVRPSWTKPRCSGCDRVLPHRACGALATRDRRWRHLDLAGCRLELSYDTHWVNCPECGRVVEAVPWSSDARARSTDEFDRQVAFLAQRCDTTTVARLMRLSWRSVGKCVEREVRRQRPGDPLLGLKVIGVDELSYRKHHRYVTVVTDLVQRRFVWGKDGKSAESLAAFFEALGAERREQIEVVCMDMSGSYIKAVREHLPKAQIVFDRFHVQALVNLAVDEVRRMEWRAVKGTPVARSVKGLRWALLKNPLTLTETQQATLSTLQKVNRPIYRAFLLKEQFRDLLDRQQVNVVRALLRKWCDWACRSRLAPFVKVSRTIRQYVEEIVAYVRWGVTNGPTEGLNTKARLATRRAYGYHSAGAVLAALNLMCSGIELDPVHKKIAA
jgi:transposase